VTKWLPFLFTTVVNGKVFPLLVRRLIMDEADQIYLETLLNENKFKILEVLKLYDITHYINKYNVHGENYANFSVICDGGQDLSINVSVSYTLNDELWISIKLSGEHNWRLALKKAIPNADKYVCTIGIKLITNFIEKLIKDIEHGVI
jgi:hypothetical protein